MASRREGARISAPQPRGRCRLDLEVGRAIQRAARLVKRSKALKLSRTAILGSAPPPSVSKDGIEEPGAIIDEPRLWVTHAYACGAQRNGAEVIVTLFQPPGLPNDTFTKLAG